METFLINHRYGFHTANLRRRVCVCVIFVLIVCDKADLSCYDYELSSMYSLDIGKTFPA